MYFKFVYTYVCIYKGAEGKLKVERDGAVTSDTEFCLGDLLTFTCTIPTGGIDWIVLPFLNGTLGKGRVSSGGNMTVGEFMLSASGVGEERTSTLQVTVFPGLAGNTTVTCREGGTTTGRQQSANITVFGEYFTLPIKM